MLNLVGLSCTHDPVRDGARLGAALQSDIATSVARGLLSSLSSDDEARLSAGSEPDREAYDLYLRARHLWNTRSVEGLRESRSLLERALALRPNETGTLYALGVVYYKLGNLELAKSYFGAVLDIEESLGPASVERDSESCLGCKKRCGSAVTRRAARRYSSGVISDGRRR